MAQTSTDSVGGGGAGSAGSGGPAGRAGLAAAVAVPGAADRAGRCGAGAGDPTYRTDADGTIWRGIADPGGPRDAAACGSRVRPPVRCAARRGVPARSGRSTRLPAMLGAEDDPSGFEPHHDVGRRAWRGHPHWRVPRTGLVMEALVPAIIEQKVTGKEAFAGFRALVHRYGERGAGRRGRPRAAG